MGADNLKNFHKWKNWKQIPKLAKNCCFSKKESFLQLNSY